MSETSLIYLSAEQVAARFGVSKDSIWRWRRNGDFPAPLKLSGRITRWRLSDIEDWENQCSCQFVFTLDDPPKSALFAG